MDFEKKKEKEKNHKNTQKTELLNIYKPTKSLCKITKVK